MTRNITPVVLNLIIINVIVFFARTSLPQFIPDLAMHFPLMEEFKPYQVVTHFFMHGSVQHLLFNMLGLFFLGPMVERTLGGKDFLKLYLICAAGALVAHLGVDYYQYLTSNGAISRFPGVVGASGAIYGVVIAFATLFPNAKLMLLFPPIPIKAKYLGIGYIAYDLYNGFMGSATGIAHFAHLGGALTGFILIKFFFNHHRRRS